jgi:hypothetical protein
MKKIREIIMQGHWKKSIECNDKFMDEETERNMVKNNTILIEPTFICI